MKLIIPKSIEERIHAYAMSVDSEIAGMGKVRIDGEDIIVEEVMIYDQTVTGATADLSSRAVAQWQSDLVKAGGSPKHWKLWWHSHDNMPAFFSGRDTATMDAQTEGDWLVSLVVNKKRERQCRVDTYRPFRMYMDNVEIEIDGQTEYQVPADIKTEVAQKVHREKPAVGFGFAREYAQASSIDKVIGLHRYCPTFTMDTKQCYLPYGKENKGVFANCATKAFKKEYGANPFMPEVDESVQPDYTGEYTRDQLVAICKTLEGQISEYENRGQGDSAQCLELSAELVDMYYELAEVETDPTVSLGVRAQAEQLESVIYQMEQPPIF